MKVGEQVSQGYGNNKNSSIKFIHLRKSIVHMLVSYIGVRQLWQEMSWKYKRDDYFRRRETDSEVHLGMPQTTEIQAKSLLQYFLNIILFNSCVPTVPLPLFGFIRLLQNVTPFFLCTSLATFHVLVFTIFLALRTFLASLLVHDFQVAKSASMAQQMTTNTGHLLNPDRPPLISLPFQPSLVALCVHRFGSLPFLSVM